MTTFLPDLSLIQNSIKFKTQQFTDEDDSDLIDIADLRDPALIGDAVTAQTSFISKLKFQYREQRAKESYVKSILSDIDDAPVVSNDDNQALANENLQNKAALKEAKVELSRKYDEIRKLAPVAEQGYQMTKERNIESNDLAQKILDARLAITRLRQSYPQPRLTITSAEQMLEDQIEEMQRLDERKQALTKKVQTLKTGIKDAERENETLRMERAELEKTVKAAGIAQDDPKIALRYNWYQTALALYRSLLRLDSLEAKTENELRLSYQIPQGRNTVLLTITLIFLPNTRQLADVQVSGVDGLNMGDAIDAHVQVNDAQGVIAAILSRASALVE